MDEIFNPFTRAHRLGSSSYSMSFRTSIAEGMLPFFPVIGHDHHSWKLLHREEVRANMFQTLFEQVVAYHAEKQVPLGVIYFDHKDELTFDFFVPNHKGKFISRSVIGDTGSRGGYFGMGIYGKEQDINKSAAKASQLPLAKREQAMPILSPLQRQYWPTYFDNALTLDLWDEASSLRTQPKIRKSITYQGKTDQVWRWQVNSEQVLDYLYRGTTVGYEQIFGIKDFMQHLSRPPYVGPINTVVIEPTLEDPLNSALTPSFLGLANYCVDNWDEEAPWQKQDLNISLDLTDSVVSFISPFFADNAQASGLSYDRYANNFMLPDRHIALKEMLSGDYQYEDYARQLSVAGSHYSNTGVFLPFAQADCHTYPRFGELIWKQVTQLLTLGVFNFAPLTDHEHYLYPQRLPGIKQLATGTAHERNYMGILPRMATNLDALVEQAVAFELQKEIGKVQNPAKQFHALLELFAQSATWSVGEVEYNQLILTLMSPFTAGNKFTALLNRELRKVKQKAGLEADFSDNYLPLETKVANPMAQAVQNIPSELAALQKNFLEYHFNIKTYASQYLNYMWADPLATVLANFNLEAIVEPDWAALVEFGEKYWQVGAGKKANWLSDKIKFYEQVWALEQIFALVQLWQSDSFKLKNLRVDFNLLDTIEPAVFPYFEKVARQLIKAGHFSDDAKTEQEISEELWESYKYGYITKIESLINTASSGIEKLYQTLGKDLYKYKNKELTDYLSQSLDFDADALFAQFNEYRQAGGDIQELLTWYSDTILKDEAPMLAEMLTISSHWMLNIRSAIAKYNAMVKRINQLNLVQTLMADYVLKGDTLDLEVLCERLTGAFGFMPQAREIMATLLKIDEEDLTDEFILEQGEETIEQVLSILGRMLSEQEDAAIESRSYWLAPFGNKINPYHLFVLRDTLTEQASVHGELNHGAYAQFLGLLKPKQEGLTISTSDQFRRPSSGNHYNDRPTTNLLLANLSLNPQQLELAGLDLEAAFDNLAYSMIRLAGYYNQTMPRYQRFFENQLVHSANLNSLKKLPNLAHSLGSGKAKVTSIADCPQLVNGFYNLGESIDEKEVEVRYEFIAAEVAKEINASKKAEAKAAKSKSKATKASKVKSAKAGEVNPELDPGDYIDQRLDLFAKKYGINIHREIYGYFPWELAHLLYLPTKSAKDYEAGSLMAKRYHAINLGGILNNLELNWSSKASPALEPRVAESVAKAQLHVGQLREKEDQLFRGKKASKASKTPKKLIPWLENESYFTESLTESLFFEVYNAFSSQWSYSPFSNNKDLQIVETYLDDFMTPKAEVALFSSKFGELAQQKLNNHLHFRGNFANLTRLNYMLDLVKPDPDTRKLINIDRITSYKLDADEAYSKTLLDFQGRAWLERWANPKTLRLDETLAFVQGLGEGKLSRQAFSGLPYQTISTAKINNLQFLAQAKTFLYDLAQPDYFDQVVVEQFILDPSLASFKYLQSLSPEHGLVEYIRHDLGGFYPKVYDFQQTFSKYWQRLFDYNPGQASNYALANFATLGEMTIFTSDQEAEFKYYWSELAKLYIPHFKHSLHLPTDFRNFQALNQYFADAVFNKTAPSQQQVKLAQAQGVLDFVSQAEQECQEYFFYTQLSKLKAGIYPRHYFTKAMTMDAGFNLRLLRILSRLQKQNQRINYGLTVARITHQLQPYAKYLEVMRQCMLNNEGYIVQGGGQTAVRLQLTADLEFLRLLDKTFSKENFVADNLLYTTEAPDNTEFWQQAFDISMGYALGSFESGMRHSVWGQKFPYNMANMMYQHSPDAGYNLRYDSDSQAMIAKQLTPAQSQLPKPKQTNLSKEVTFWLGDNAIRNLEFFSKPFIGFSFEFSRGGSLNLAKLPILSVIDLQDMANPYREELNPNDRPSVPDALSEAYDIRSLNIQRGILSGSFDFTTGGMFQLHNYCHNLYLGTSRSPITHPEKVHFRALEDVEGLSDLSRNSVTDFISEHLLAQEKDCFQGKHPEIKGFVTRTISTLASRLGISQHSKDSKGSLFSNFQHNYYSDKYGEIARNGINFPWYQASWEATAPFRNRNREQWIYNQDHFENWKHARLTSKFSLESLEQAPQEPSKLSDELFAHFDLYRQDFDGLIAHTEVNKDIAAEVFQVWQESQSGSLSSQLCWGTNNLQRKLLVEALAEVEPFKFDLMFDCEIRQQSEQQLQLVVNMLGAQADKATKSKLSNYFRLIEDGYYDFEESYFNRIPFEITSKTIEQLVASLQEVEQALFSYQLTARTGELLAATMAMNKEQLEELVTLRFSQFLAKVEQLETDLIPCLILTISPKAVSKEYHLVTRLRDLIYASPLLRILREQLMQGSSFSKFVAQREQENKRVALASSPVTAFLSKPKKAKKGKKNNSHPNAPPPGVRQAQIKDRYLKAAIEKVSFPGVDSLVLGSMGLLQERIMLGVDKASASKRIWELPINDILRKQSYTLCDIAVARAMSHYFADVYPKRLNLEAGIDFYSLAKPYSQEFAKSLTEEGLLLLTYQARDLARSELEPDLLADLTADMILTHLGSINYYSDPKQIIHLVLESVFEVAHGFIKAGGVIPKLDPNRFKPKLAQVLGEAEIKARVEQLFTQIRAGLKATVQPEQQAKRAAISQNLDLLTLRQLSLEKLVQLPIFAPYLEEEEKAKYHAYLQEVYRLSRIMLDSEGDKKSKLVEAQLWLLNKAQDLFIMRTQPYHESPWTDEEGYSFELDGLSPSLIYGIYDLIADELSDFYRQVRQVWMGNPHRLNNSLGLALQQLSEDQFEINDEAKKEVLKEIKGKYPSLYETYFNPQREVSIKPLHLDFIDPSKLSDSFALKDLQSPELMAKAKGMEIPKSKPLGFPGFTPVVTRLDDSDKASSKAKSKAKAKTSSKTSSKTATKTTAKSAPKTTGKSIGKVSETDATSLIRRLIDYMPHLNRDSEKEPGLARLMDIFAENVEAVLFGGKPNLEQLKLVLEVCQSYYGEVEKADPSMFQVDLSKVGIGNVKAARKKLSAKEAKAKEEEYKAARVKAEKEAKAKAEKEAKAAKAKAEKEAKAAQAKAEKEAKAAKAKAEKEAKAAKAKAEKEAKAAQAKAEKEAKAAQAKAEKEAKAAKAKAEKEAKALALKEAKAAKAAQLKAEKEAKAAQAKAEKAAKAAQAKAEKATKAAQAKAEKAAKAKAKTPKAKTPKSK